jgi:hypothetical protein
MLIENLTIYLNSITQAMLLKGFSLSDFSHSIEHYPQNLLLLESTNSTGIYEPTIRLCTILGRNNVATYFQNVQQNEHPQIIKWIDFSDLSLLKELSSLELSELLYLSHMKKPITSPYFYKLQNHFIYFNDEMKFSKIYYRSLNEFYRMLASKIVQLTFFKINNRMLFLRKKILIEKPTLEFLEKMKPLFEKGIKLAFTKATFTRHIFVLPIYLKNPLNEDESIEQKKIALAAHLVYHSKEKAWTLQ